MPVLDTGAPMDETTGGILRQTRQPVQPSPLTRAVGATLSGLQSRGLLPTPQAAKQKPKPKPQISERQKAIDALPSVDDIRKHPGFQDLTSDEQQMVLNRWHEVVSKHQSWYQNSDGRRREIYDARMAGQEAPEAPTVQPEAGYIDVTGSPTANTLANIAQNSAIGRGVAALTGGNPYITRPPEGALESGLTTAGTLGADIASFAGGAGLAGRAASAAGMGTRGAQVMSALGGTVATSGPAGYANVQSGQQTPGEAARDFAIDAGLNLTMPWLAAKVPGASVEKAVQRGVLQAGAGSGGTLAKGQQVTPESVLTDFGSNVAFDVMAPGGPLARRRQASPIEPDMTPQQPEPLLLPPGQDHGFQQGDVTSQTVRADVAPMRTASQLGAPDQPAGLVGAGEDLPQLPPATRFTRPGVDDPIYAGPAPKQQRSGDLDASLAARADSLRNEIAAIDNALQKPKLPPKRAAKLRQARAARQSDLVALERMNEPTYGARLPEAPDHQAQINVERTKAVEARNMAEAELERAAEKVDTFERQGRKSVLEYKPGWARMRSDSEIAEIANRMADTDEANAYRQAAAEVLHRRQEARRLGDPGEIDARMAEQRHYDLQEAERQRTERARTEYRGVRPDAPPPDDDIPAFDDPIPPKTVADLVGITDQLSPIKQAHSGVNVLQGIEQGAKLAGKISRAFDAASVKVINAAGRALGLGELVDPVSGTIKASREAFDRAGRWLRAKKQNEVADKISAAVIDKYGLPEDYLAARQNYERTRNQIATQFDSFAKERLANLTPDEQRAVYEIVTNENAAPGVYQGLRDDLRKLVDDLGQRAVNAGVISQEAYDRNKGEYLSRSYAERELGQSKTVKAVGKAIRFASAQMKGRGMWRSVDDATLAKLRKVGTSKAGNPVYQVRGEQWELREPGALWRDYTKAERKQMGEIEDATYAFLKTGDQISRNIATGEFYQTIAKNQELAKRPTSQAEARQLEADGWVKVSGDIQGTGGKKRWGALDGMHVHPDVHRDLTELQRMQTSGLWKQILGQWKLNKTARNPAVHLNNIMSNVTLLELNGGNADDAWTALRVMRGEGGQQAQALYKQAQEDGVFDSTFLADDIAKLKGSMPNPNGQTTLEKAWSWVKSADAKMLEAYGAEDNAFRLALYLEKIRQGAPREEAAQIAKTAFVDYTITAPLINTMRNSVFPFMAYAYRALPLMARGVAERPWKVAKIALFWQLMNKVMSSAAGGNEDEERAAMQGTMKNEPFMMRAPFKDALGQQRYFDTTRFIPGADIVGGVIGAAKGEPEQVLNGLSNTFSMGGPIVAAVDVARNRNPMTGQPIRNENTPASRQAIDLGKYLYEQATPNAPWVPGSYAFNKIVAAAQQRPDQAGRMDTVPMAALSTLGVKTPPVSPADLEAKRALKLKGEIDRAEEVINRAARRMGDGRMTEAQFNRIVAEQQSVIDKAQQRFAKYQDRLAKARGGDRTAGR